MKNDRQFIESIYEKTAERVAARKKFTALALTATLIIVAMTSAVMLLPIRKPNASKGGKDVQSPNVAISSAGETGQSKENVISTDGLTDKVVLLTCPITETDEEPLTDTKIKDNFSLTAPVHSSKFYDTLQEYRNENARFLVALEINPLTTFTYQGRYLTEIFENVRGVYYFADDNHKEFNSFIGDYTEWYCHGGLKIIQEELDNSNADITTYMAFYYNSVWVKDKTKSELAILAKQRDEYEAIWTEFDEKGDDIHISAYEEEEKRLVAEGYDLECVTVDGITKLVGALNAEQILEFNDNENFVYSCVWLKASYGDHYDVTFTPPQSKTE